MSPALFLRRHWQKRPFLVRGAFPGFRDPLTPSELAGLSCEESVESRLVMERGGTKPWQVTHGPQSAARLRRLPESHWTLLVQGVDRLMPGAAALLDSFRFIPDWRVDDVMVSFAPRGGSVGPHVDGYDVFLLQGLGRRRWRIAEPPQGEMRPGLDLRVLRRFRPEREWVLGPGDMLYLPPGVAHHGVALEDCLTYSIGFRAPGAAELLAAAVPRLAGSAGPASRYRDPGLRPARHSGRIPPETLREMRALMEEGVRGLKTDELAAIVGEVLTEPKDLPPGQARASASSARSRLRQGAALSLRPGGRLAFWRRGAAARLFADGRGIPLGPALSFAAPLLSGRRRWSAEDMAPHLGKPGFIALVAEMISSGTLRWDRGGARSGRG